MANKNKGEVEFKAGGETYKLRFSIDSLCELEDLSGKGIAALAQELSDPAKVSIKLMRQVFWAGLRDNHPDINLKAAGELIVEAGGMLPVAELVGQAFTLAFPQRDDDTTTAERPQKPSQNGTGSALRERGAGQD